MSLYWEQQGNDLLCGVHCLNSLLQGPFFDEVDLGLIAQELDYQEKNILAQNGMDSKDFLEFVAGDSHNVADAGNYSIQVIEKALSKYKLKCKSVSSFELTNQELSNETGFICHHSMHWYSLRKVDGVWYCLNSLQKNPYSLSDFYLSALLSHFQEQGQSIFLVYGIFPYSKKLIDKKGLQNHQKLLNADEVIPYQIGNKKSQNKKDNSDNYFDIPDDNSKRYNTRNVKLNFEGMDLEKDNDYFDPEFKTNGIKSKQKDQSFVQNASENEYINKDQNDNKMGYIFQNNNNSNKDNHQNNKIDYINLSVWINTQIRYKEKFHIYNVVEDLYDFVIRKEKKFQNKNFVLYTNIPEKRYFNDKSETLEKAELLDDTVLHIKQW